MRNSLFSLAMLAALPLALAGEVDVVDARIAKSGDAYRADVTLRHADTGWDHYADRWDILAPDGTVLGTRVLYHPHVEEQPFTRSLSGVVIPADVKRVIVRGHDKVHGYRGKTLELDIP